MNRQEELVSLAKQTIVLNDAVDSQGDTVLGAMVDSGELSDVEYLEVCSIMKDMKSHNTPSEGEINVNGAKNFMMPYPGWDDKKFHSDNDLIAQKGVDPEEAIPDKEEPKTDGNYNYTKPGRRQVIHKSKEEKKDEDHES